MHFYRPLNRIQAITFDLDDTLYDNRPVIERTEQALLAHLHQQHPESQAWDREQMRQFRMALRERDPDIGHDVTRWRWQSIYLMLQQWNYTPAQARQGADDALSCFAHWRSQVTVPEETHRVLQQLGRSVPLLAITNGNADPHSCGLGGYFKFILRGGPDGRAKPWPDMYLNAARRLDVAPGNILHVGDDLTADIAGAIRSGVQACWINDREGNLRTAEHSSLLPHLEISRLASLMKLERIREGN